MNAIDAQSVHLPPKASFNNAQRDQSTPIRAAVALNFVATDRPTDLNQMANTPFTTRIGSWQVRSPFDRPALFAELSRVHPDDPEVAFLYGCAVLRMGRFADAATAFEKALVKWPNSTACLLLAKTSTRAEHAGLHRPPYDDPDRPPSFTAELTALCWQEAADRSIRTISEGDPAQPFLVYAMSTTAHFGQYVKCPGEIIARVMGVIELKYGVRSGVYPPGHCRICGSPRPTSAEGPCPGCESRWNREGEELSYAQRQEFLRQAFAGSPRRGHGAIEAFASLIRRLVTSIRTRKTRRD